MLRNFYLLRFYKIVQNVSEKTKQQMGETFLPL